jgi:peptidoglycan/xylan/chitin deacetylase (PgdA/CDA1 family)
MTDIEPEGAGVGTRGWAAAALVALLLLSVGGGVLAVGLTGRSSAHAPTRRAAAASPVPADVPPPAPPGSDEIVPLGKTSIRVPVLEYHYVRVVTDPRDRLGFALSVTPQALNAQLDWLQANGYHAVVLEDLRAYFAGQAPLPARPVVLTFDDGYLDFYSTAFPILEAHRFRAVSYVVPGFIGRPGYMSTEQVLDVDRAGMEVGAHTMRHLDLTKLSPGDLDYQVGGSRQALEQLLGHPVLDFCYPSGKFNGTVVAAVQNAGLQTATTELPGTNRSWSDRLLWSRTRVNGGETLQQFVAALGEPEPTVAPPHVESPAGSSLNSGT